MGNFPDGCVFQDKSIAYTLAAGNSIGHDSIKRKKIEWIFFIDFSVTTIEDAELTRL